MVPPRELITHIAYVIQAATHQAFPESIHAGLAPRYASHLFITSQNLIKFTKAQPRPSILVLLSHQSDRPPRILLALRGRFSIDPRQPPYPFLILSDIN